MRARSSHVPHPSAVATRVVTRPRPRGFPWLGIPAPARNASAFAASVWLASLLVGCVHTPPAATTPGDGPTRAAADPAPTNVRVLVTPPTPAREAEPPRPTMNQDIVICGKRVAVGAPVVLWTEAPFYDATSSAPHFSAPRTDGKGPKGLRYQPGRVRRTPNPAYVPPPRPGTTDTRTDAQKLEWIERELVSPASDDPRALAQVVDQFVLHFDVCGLSRTCFRVLQDERGLSVHFLLDLDGTIYQTMDLRDTAWHATKSNPRSIGVEIANMGAYAPREAWRLTDWYRRDESGTYVRIPPRIKDTGLRTPNFLGRPARDSIVIGSVQGEQLHQYDFTPQQYQSLVALSAALCRELPKIRPDAPRDAEGWVLDRALDDDAWARFGGILGHYHVQTNKTDPGPAFDWEPFLDDVRARLGRASADSRRRP